MDPNAFSIVSVLLGSHSEPIGLADLADRPRNAGRAGVDMLPFQIPFRLGPVFMIGSIKWSLGSLQLIAATPRSRPERDL